jgi:Holliday junction resolvase
MANRAKQKGTSFETLIRQYLNDNGFPNAQRTVLKGGGDTGDINGIKNSNRQIAVQCKNQKSFSLSAWLNDTVEQADNLGGALPALVVKRPGKGEKALGDSYVVMRLSDLVSLLQEADYS